MGRPQKQFLSFSLNALLRGLCQVSMDVLTSENRQVS